MEVKNAGVFSPYINLVFADQQNLSVNITIIVPLSLKSAASEVEIHQVFESRISALIRDVTSFIENNIDQKPIENKIETQSETKFAYYDDLPSVDAWDNDDKEAIEGKVAEPTVIGFKKKEKREYNKSIEYNTGHIEVSCEECGELVKKSRLSYHIQKHHKELCLNCGKYFTQTYYKYKHYYKCNNLPNPNYPDEEEGSHICQHCGKEFKMKVHLDTHVKYVHKEEEFMCHLCDFKSKIQYQLKIHISRRHTKNAEVTCDICNKTYANNLQLKQHHRKKHSGRAIEMTSCETCGKEFRTLYLQKHIDKVHAPKKYHCQQCDYKAGTSYNLKLHVNKMHLGLKEIPKESCPHCDVVTTNLKHHIAQYHPCL